MKNLAGHPESMRAVAEKLLANAVEHPEFVAPSACVDGCSDNVVSEVVYEVAPTAFLPQEKQEAICLQLEQSTKSKPLNFKTQEFSSIEQLHQWISEFTRGKGDEGEKLYDICASNCSPRYTFYINKMGDNLRLNSDVLCGLARDRDNEQYSISTTIRQTCHP